MVNAYIKLQIGNRYYRNIFIIIIFFLLTSCGTPTTVVKRGQVSEIDKERVIMQGIALDTYYKSCLLYTSPSPRDRQKSRMPSSA